MIVEQFGPEKWKQIMTSACITKEEAFVMHNYYQEDVSNTLLKAIIDALDLPLEQILEKFGEYFIDFVMKGEWFAIIQCLAEDMLSFINNIDSLHYFAELIIFKHKLQWPSFSCNTNSDGSLTLYYWSHRIGLYPIVIGIIHEIAKRLFEYEVTVSVIERKQRRFDDNCEENVSFLIKLNENYANSGHTLIAPPAPLIGESYSENLSLNLIDFSNVCPYHVCFDESLNVLHFGGKLARFFRRNNKEKPNLMDLMDIVQPNIEVNYDDFVKHQNSVFIFKLINTSRERNDGQNELCLKGQIVLLEDKKSMIFICSPLVSTIKELLQKRLYLNDIPLHDVTKDLILLNQSMNAQHELNKRLEENSKQLQIAALELQKEKEKSENLLNDLLPPSIVQRLKQGQKLETGEYPEATVLFTDIVGFTVLCSRCKPIEVVDLLNDLYSKFDTITTMHNVYKVYSACVRENGCMQVMTIGDAYMVVGGVPDVCENHVERICYSAIAMLRLSKTVSKSKHLALEIRVGIHTGSVMTNVIGTKQPRFNVFGDTVLIANKMESAGCSSKIHVSSALYEAAAKYGFLFQEASGILIKGFEQKTYYLVKHKTQTVWSIADMKRGANESIDGYEELNAIVSEPKSSSVTIGSGNSLFFNNDERPFIDDPGVSITDSKELKCIVQYKDKEYTIYRSKLCF